MVVSKPRKIFYGWWIVSASAGILMAFAGIGFYSFGNLFIPLEEKFGWTRAQISGGQSMFLLFSGITGVFVGRLAARYGIRRMVFTGAPVAAASLILLSRMTALWHLYLLYGVLGVGLMWGGIIPIATTVANWFVEFRGRAMGLTMLGIAFGALVFSPLAGILVDNFSWRTTYVILGFLVLAVDIPLALILRNKPEDMGLAPDGRSPASVKAPAGEQGALSPNPGLGIRPGGEELVIAIKSPGFWLITTAFLLMGTGTVAVLQHEVPLIRDMGVSAGTAALALGLTGGIGAVGKVGFGILSEKIPVRYATMMCFGLQALGLLILLNAQGMAMVWVFVVIFGIGMGANITLLPLVIGNLFPMSIFAAIFGLVNLGLSTGGGIIGPPLAGYLRDVSGDYDRPLTLFIIAYIVGLALVYLAWGLKPKIRTHRLAEGLPE